MRHFPLIVYLWLVTELGPMGAATVQQPPKCEEPKVLEHDSQAKETRIVPQFELADQEAMYADGAFSCSPDGGTLAVEDIGVGPDSPRSLVLWDVEGRKVLHRLRHPEAVRSIQFTPKGDRVIAGCTGAKKLFVWDVRSGKLLDTLEMAGHVGYGVTGLALFPDGKRLLCCAGGELALWDLEARKSTLLPPGKWTSGAGTYNRVAISPDGLRFVTTVSNLYSEDRLLIWDSKTNQIVHDVRQKTVENCLVYAPDGKSFAMKRSGAVYYPARPEPKAGAWVCLRDPISARIFLEGRVFNSQVHALAYSPDGKYLLIAGEDYSPGAPQLGANTIGVWEVATGKALRRFLTPRQLLGKIAVSPDGKWLVVNGKMHAVSFYAMDEVLGKKPGAPATSENGTAERTNK